MKKRMVGLFVLLMIVGMAGAMPVAAHEFKTDTDGYIKIALAEDLTAFSAAIKDGTLPITTNARLTENIVLNEGCTVDWKDWAVDTLGLVPWIPIGSDAKAYNGTFDGDDHTVSGIYINSSDR